MIFFDEKYIICMLLVEKMDFIIIMYCYVIRLVYERNVSYIYYFFILL